MKPIKLLLLFLLCIALTLSTAACKNKTLTPEEQIIYYSIPFEPDSLDPQIANDSASRLIVMNIFEGLVRLDSYGKPASGVAKDWKTSDDETVYTFYLREDAHWSNGDPVTAEDFLYGLQRTLDPHTGSPAASTLYCIKNAEAVHLGKSPLSALGITANKNSLVITLEKPDSSFLTTLATPAAMPCQKAFFQSAGGQYGREDDKLISNGPFYVRASGWSHNEYIYLRKNPEYHGSETPVPAGVNIAIADAPENVCDAIEDGTVDCYALPGGELAQAEEKGLNLTSFGETVWGIAFNTENEVLSHPEIRRALLSAIDRRFVLQEVPEGCTETTDIIPDSVMLGGYSYRSHAPAGLSVPLSDNPRQELQKALKSCHVEELPALTILCTDDSATQKIVNNLIETWNTQTGCYINKNPVSASELNDAVLSGEFRIVIAPLMAGGSSPVDTISLFTSDSSYNVAGLKDARFDSMIESARELTGDALLHQIIESEEYLNDQAVFYPLYCENRYYACAPNVSGIIFHSYGAGVDFFFAKKTGN